MKRTHVAMLLLLTCFLGQGTTRFVPVAGLHFQENEETAPYSFYYPYDYRYYYPDAYGKSSDSGNPSQSECREGRCFAPKVSE